MGDMKIKFSFIGFIVFMLPMLINFVYFAFPSENATDKAVVTNKIIDFIENATRILYGIGICLLVSKQKLDFKSPWFFVGMVFLVLYYIVWIRYFVGGRDVALINKSFLFVPMPLAIFPVLYFLCEAIWLHNYAAFAIMIVFGIAHNINTYQSFH